METPTPDLNQTVHPAIIPPHEDKLQTLLTLYVQMQAADEALETAERVRNQAKDRYEDLALRLIPAVMADLGLKEIRMADGRILSIKPEYYGSVAQTRMPAAVEWLAARNMDGIVKKELVVSEWSAEELQALRDAGIDYTLKQTIHPSTLRAFVRERLELNDPDFPKELFAASVVNRAVLSDRA